MISESSELKEYQIIKEKVLSKKNALEKRIQSIDQNLKHHKDGSAVRDLEEHSINLQNEEIIDALSERDQEELRQIETALRNLEFGTYGVCKLCGNKIPQKRLQALPYTQFCLDCAS